jgi:hypothetical protein
MCRHCPLLLVCSDGAAAVWKRVLHVQAMCYGCCLLVDVATDVLSASAKVMHALSSVLHTMH